MKNCFDKMMSLDIYTSNLTNDEYSKIANNLTLTSKKSINILSWGIQQLFMSSTVSNDINVLKNLRKNYNWKNNITSILNENYYEALVLTDVTKKIIWANDGFSKMTGYDIDFVINKTGRFFQGEKTKESTRKRIRNKLLKGKPFKDIIVNYRKDKSYYKCELYIIPLYKNSPTEVTHFLALEKEIA
ncbi:PAS domain-containing protein [Tenacibaculum sp. IMCC1]|uniref:PAS domain-containing protein n=1 Tax=Tenacibaculum mesophilum TaxID=104268 RepID=UPI003F617267